MSTAPTDGLPAAFLSYLAETRSNTVRDEVLKLLDRLGAEPDVAVIALADVLAVIAAMDDRNTAGRTLKDQLHAVCARVEETYNRVRHGRERKPV